MRERERKLSHDARARVSDEVRVSEHVAVGAEYQAARAKLVGQPGDDVS